MKQLSAEIFSIMKTFTLHSSSVTIAKSAILEYAKCSSRQAKLHIFKSLKVLKKMNVRTSEALFCLQNQRFGCRWSRCDDTFKGNGEPVERKRPKDFRQVCIYNDDRPYDINPFENSGFTSRIFPWSSTSGLMSYTARRRDTIKYKELSLRCLPGHILGKSPWARILENMLDLPTDVQTQIPQSLGPSHRDWFLRLSDTVQAGIPWGR